MSSASTLLELQNIDLELMRNQELLQSLPEITELARKRKTYLKLKSSSTKLLAQRKDIENDLEELDEQKRTCDTDVEQARREIDMSDYKQVQQLEIDLSSIAKRLDKIEFDYKAKQELLDKATAAEEDLKARTQQLEEAIVSETKSARAHAAELQTKNDSLAKKRTHMLETLPAPVAKRYTDASAKFNGLAVEQLNGNIPSVCRTSLQASSMNDLKYAGEIAECPYCHRLLVVGPEEE